MHEKIVFNLKKKRPERLEVACASKSRLQSLSRRKEKGGEERKTGEEEERKQGRKVKPNSSAFILCV